MSYLTSVLDKSPIRDGGTPEQALRPESAELGRFADGRPQLREQLAAGTLIGGHVARTQQQLRRVNEMPPVQDNHSTGKKAGASIDRLRAPVNSVRRTAARERMVCIRCLLPRAFRRRSGPRSISLCGPGDLAFPVDTGVMMGRNSL